ncbi:MAG: hypothetical protein ISP32_03010 [Thermoleophilia bacterium]|nr:hypothetical protein [Thermoleophilia bacterium]
MSRFRQGLELAGVSWRTIVNDRSLAVFPVLGAISAVALTAAFVIPGLFLVADEAASTALMVTGIVLFAIAAYLAAFVGIFFSVALASCANRSLQGEDTTVRQGIAAARERIPQIAGWALVTTTVNLILRAIEARFQGVGGAIVSALGGLAWALVTFLAVPVIAFEGTGPLQTLKRSSGLFRQRWGQQVVGLGVTTGVVALFGILPGIAMLFFGIAIAPSIGGFVLIVIGALAIIVASILSATLSQVLAVALYRFAADGVAVGPFTEEQLQSVVRPRRGRGEASPI